jgi:hypothetical protein
MLFSPRRVPASETRVALNRIGIGAQLLCSLARRTPLVMLNPHSCDGELVKRSVLKGISNSAIHPPSNWLTFTSQTPSQSMFPDCPSLDV